MSGFDASLILEGAAFWAPRLPGWDIARAVIRGEQAAPEAVATRPVAALLAPTERRRAPDTVAVALEVASRACAAAGRSPQDLPAVFASTHGDLAISDYMCSTLVSTPTLISPVKFHNSVHNAAAGYWSIGTGSYASYTALSAFGHTFAQGLLEAASQALCEQRAVLYVAFDIEAKGALATMAPSRGVLGAAVVLSPEGAAGAVPSQGAARRVRLTAVSDHSEPTPPVSPAAALVADNALAPLFPFFEALAADEPRSLIATLSAGAALRIELQ